MLKNTFNTEICVSVRNSVADTFSLPTVVHSNIGFFPEAASPSSDKQRIYYHQKDGTGFFHLYLRYRTGTTGIYEHSKSKNIKVFPNPTNNIFNIDLPNSKESFSLAVYSSHGKELFRIFNNTSVDISNLPNGIYFLTIIQSDKIWRTKMVKE